MTERTDYQKKVQAKHVPSEPLLRAIATAEGCLGAVIWDLFALPEMAAYPEKVVRAKLQQMVNGGLISGCCCGCRGDFTLVEPAISPEEPLPPRR